MDPLTIAYILLVVGLLLLIGEAFVPTSGALFLACSLCLLTGLALVFYYGDAYTGWLTLLGVFVAVPVVGVVALYVWPKTPVGKRLMRPPADADDTVAKMPVLVELEQLRGRFGRALSDLRPAGVAEIDGRRVDVMSEGMLIPGGASVRVIDVRAGRVVVRAAEPPSLENMETDFS
jgi:membrane-bound ClpP family serine protease